MKNYLIYLSLCLLNLQCTKVETIDKLFIPCDCKDYPMLYEYKELEGTILFPTKVGQPYRVIIPIFEAASAGELPYTYNVCADSVAINLIRINKITDSTAIVFNGGGVDKGPPVNDSSCRGLAAFRITRMRKAQ